jgi:glucose/mannose transport system substrate-binding protein
MKRNLRFPLAGLLLLLATQIPFAAFAADKKLEVFSWWTSGGEAAALDALFQAYKKADPGVQIVNATVAGGGGSAARPVLQARLAGGSPPDTWQTHPGWELLGQYVPANYCEPITDIYQSEGWDKVVPKSLIDLLSKDQKTYAVLVGVHRGNVLWYNKKVLQKAGVTVGDKMTFEDFFAAVDKLKAAGVTPLAVGDSGIWATAELFENTLLGTVGPQGWTDLFSGKMAWDDPKVKQAVATYGKFLGYQNRDHSAFGVLKGCIPARTDADKAKFGPYHNWSMQSFANDRLVASCVHGEAAPAGFQQALNDAITSFVVDKNAEGFVQALTQAAKDADMAK